VRVLRLRSEPYPGRNHIRYCLKKGIWTTYSSDFVTVDIQLLQIYQSLDDVDNLTTITGSSINGETNSNTPKGADLFVEGEMHNYSGVHHPCMAIQGRTAEFHSHLHETLHSKVRCLGATSEPKGQGNG
jgi:hypothetical protein